MQPSMQQNREVAFLKMQVMSLMQTLHSASLIIKRKEEELQQQTALSESLIKSNIQNAMELLTNKIQKQIAFNNLPPTRRFLSVRIEWIEGFETYLRSWLSGRLVQPLPTFRPESMVTKRVWSTTEELEQLFPTKLRKDFPLGGWAQLEAPFEITWSKTTRKLCARFTYAAYLKNGLFYFFFFLFINLFQVILFLLVGIFLPIVVQY